MRYKIASKLRLPSLQAIHGPTLVDLDLMSGKLHIGTSGWSYKDWVGIFYPANMKMREWLVHYARVFDCTEINSSFYRLPSQQTIADWLSKVPKDFLFCPKMSRYLTHLKRLKEPAEPLQRFFSIFEVMQPQMGPVLIQLPASTAFDAAIAENLYAILAEKYSSYQFAIEVRHSSWMTRESYELMMGYDIAFVISHSGNHFPYAEVVTGKNIYFRFHGPGSLYDSKYDDEALKNYALLFNNWLLQGHDLWIFFNNDWYGYGIDNAITLRKYLTDLKHQAPAGSGSENSPVPK